MSLTSTKYQLDLLDRPVAIKAPAGKDEKETNARFERSLDLFHIGNNFEEEGKIEMALNFYSESLAYNPTMSLALLRRSKINISIGNLQEALNDLFSYRNQQPQCSRGLLYLARVSNQLWLQSGDDFHRNNFKRYLDWAVIKNPNYKLFIVSEN